MPSATMLNREQALYATENEHALAQQAQMKSMYKRSVGQGAGHSGPSLLDALKRLLSGGPATHPWDVWVVTQDTSAWGGGPNWAKVLAGSSTTLAGICNYLATLPGSFGLSTNPQFVHVYVVKHTSSGIAVKWEGYLPQVLAAMGCV